MAQIQMRQITDEQLDASKIAATKTIKEQLDNNTLSKKPPVGWKGSVVGEVVFFKEKLLPLDKYAQDVAHEALETQKIEIPSKMIGIGFRASPKEKELIEFIKEQIRTKEDKQEQ